MIWSIVVAYEDGTEMDTRVDHNDLDAATHAALDLADYLGKHPKTDGHGRPAAVRIKRGNKTEISIRILSGGLKG